MAAVKKAGAAQQGFTSSDKARFLLRPAQKTDQLCKNPKPCSYGDRCIFAHNMEEQRRFRQAFGNSISGGFQGAGAKAFATSSTEQTQHYCPPDKFKTALCYYFDRQGYCTRGDKCCFAHGEGELRSAGYRSRDSTAAEFSPAPPPPTTARAPRSSASAAGSVHSSEADVQGGIAPAELDEAYALQLQYDEQRCLKEETQQAQHGRQANPPPAERPACCSYAAAASAGTEALAAPVAPPPGLPLPKLDSKAAFTSLKASGAGSKAGSEAARSQQHSRAHSSGGCSADGGTSPITACPSEEGTQRAPSSCNGSVAAEAELAAHAADGSESAPEDQCTAEEQEEGPGVQQQEEEAGCSAAGHPGGEAANTPGTTGPQRVGSRTSWADEMEAEEAEEAQQQAAARGQGLLPPPPPPPPRQLQPHITPPAELLLQALRSSTAAAAAAAAAAAPTDSGSPLRPGVLPPPGFKPRGSAGVRTPQPRPNPIEFLGSNGGVDLSAIPHFVCPLTNRTFVDPVVAADGVTYERDVIEFLLYRKNIEVSPVLRGVRLEHSLLVPNTALLCAMGEVAALLASMAAS